MTRMEDIQAFRKFLGSIAMEYNDAQLRQLSNEMNALADMLLDIYLSRHGKHPPQREMQVFDRWEASS